MSLLNYKIIFNDQRFSKNKKNIILLIRRSSGELDWILPLLFVLKEKYNIFTIFRFKKTLNLIKENKILYDLWKRTSFGYTLEPKYKSVILKILYNLLKKTIFKNYFKNKFQNSYYNLSDIRNLIIDKENKDLKVEAVFSEFSNFSPWINNFYNTNKQTKIIHFPHTTNIFGTKKIKIKEKKKVGNNYLLLSNTYDYKFWKDRFSNSNIIETGYLKYDQSWLKKILSKNKKKYKKIVYVSYSGYLKKKYNFDKYKEQIINIMDTCTKIPNVKIFFKIHPSTDKKELIKILELYPKKKWQLAKDNQLRLAKLSDIFIALYSSASIIEGLAVNKTPIELWNIMNKTNYKSKFKDLKLTLHVKNKYDFENKIRRLLNKSILYNEQKQIRDNFKKNFFTYGSINYTKKKILKILEEKKH